MDTSVDRPHRSNSNNSSGTSNSNTGELFICFTSRLSSSSMKLPSRSILSPSGHRDSSHISLSNSLSRRLRSNGSMKGGQASPMFPSNGKKRGCAFENPEPSSPKVTCIGQVRVKTKKQGKKLRTRSKRRGEINFRRVDQTDSNNLDVGINHQDLLNNQFLNQQQQQQQEGFSHRNQRWVHLPLTICETLRAFGAEFNCFLPCRSSCMASEKDREEKAAAPGSNNGGSSCGAVFARWLMAVQEGEGKGKEIELVVGGEEEEEEQRDERRSYRRHVFEEIEFKDEKNLGEIEGLKEEEARVSICVPPKNALLLMRCRSDPVKMAALANKFWEAPAPQDEDEEEDNEGGERDRRLGLRACCNAEDKGEDGAGHEGEKGKTEQETILEQKEVLIVSESLASCETIEKPHQIDQETEEMLVLLEGESGEDRQEVRITKDKIGGVLREDLVKQEEEEEETDVLEVMNQPAASTEEIVALSNNSSSYDPETLMNLESEDRMLQENSDNHEDRLGAKQEQGEDFSDDIFFDQLTSVSVEFEQETLQVAVQDLRDQLEAECEPEHGVEAYKTSAETEEELRIRKEISGNRVKQVEEEEKVTSETIEIRSESEDPKTPDGQTGLKSKERDDSQTLLPDCLRLMMWEPKLSMEVSKETWVCSTDFIRWLPEHSRAVNKTSVKDEPKKRVSIDNNNPAPVHNNMITNSNNNHLQQPPRSSCSYPAKEPARGAGTESMSTMIEQKLGLGLGGAKAYEPFVLTRCKSEPMRSASKLATEACFWKNRKLEPHRRGATLGFGAAGVGF